MPTAATVARARAAVEASLLADPGSQPPTTARYAAVMALGGAGAPAPGPPALPLSLAPSLQQRTLAALAWATASTPHNAAALKVMLKAAAAAPASVDGLRSGVGPSGVDLRAHSFVGRPSPSWGLRFTLQPPLDSRYERVISPERLALVRKGFRALRRAWRADADPLLRGFRLRILGEPGTRVPWTVARPQGAQRRPLPTQPQKMAVVARLASLGAGWGAGAGAGAGAGGGGAGAGAGAAAGAAPKMGGAGGASDDDEMGRAAAAVADAHNADSQDGDAIAAALLAEQDDDGGDADADADADDGRRVYFGVVTRGRAAKRGAEEEAGRGRVKRRRGGEPADEGAGAAARSGSG